MLTMPFYTEEQLRQLAGTFSTVPRRAQELGWSFLRRAYVSDAGKEYAHQGFVRRLNTLARCINRIFTFLPPAQDTPLERETQIDATVFLQASVFHTFGALDNLAFIWVHERNVTGRNGRLLPKRRIGLNSNMEEVRASLTAELRTRLDKLAGWFAYLEGFRHGLAHRIALYIPPHTVRPEDADRYLELESQMFEAGLRGNMEERERLEAEQMALVSFRPWMVHSVTERNPVAILHPQVLADFATVEEIGRKILDDLDAPVA